jgi:predicted transposase YbfD/YdcC
LLQTELGHGRVDERGLVLRPVEPTAINFPFARTLVAIQSRRTVKRTGQSSFETRYYLSSQEAVERSHPEWIQLIRDHWGGVENRNHWRRDALWGEDRTRSRKPNVVANLALLRSAASRLLNDHYPDQNHAELRETLAHKPNLSLLSQKS